MLLQNLQDNKECKINRESLPPKKKNNNNNNTNFSLLLNSLLYYNEDEEMNERKKAKASLEHERMGFYAISLVPTVFSSSCQWVLIMFPICSPCSCYIPQHIPYSTLLSFVP
jgi:hypothetical protein